MSASTAIFLDVLFTGRYGAIGRRRGPTQRAATCSASTDFAGDMKGRGTGNMYERPSVEHQCADEVRPAGQPAAHSPKRRQGPRWMSTRGAHSWQRRLATGLVVGTTAVLLPALPATSARAQTCIETADTGVVCTPSTDSPTIVDGAIPTDDPTNPYVPDPTLVRQHVDGEVSVSAAVAQALAENVTQPPQAAIVNPDGTISALTGELTSGGVPSYAHTGLAPQYQQRTYWCGPASGDSALSSAGISITQSTMATYMKTSTKGTYEGNMPPAMNRYRDWYIADTVSSPSDLMNKDVEDTYYVGLAFVIFTQGSGLPWWQQHNFTGQHAVTVYGYYTGSGGGVYMWDPLNESWAGYHTLGLAKTYAAMGGNGYGIVW